MPLTFAVEVIEVHPAFVATPERAVGTPGPVAFIWRVLIGGQIAAVSSEWRTDPIEALRDGYTAMGGAIKSLADHAAGIPCNEQCWVHDEREERGDG